MNYKLTKNGIERPFVPERDLIRLIKYGTYDLLELDDMMPEDLDINELSEEEEEIIANWYIEFAEQE